MRGDVPNVPNVSNEDLVPSKKYSFRIFINQYGGFIALGVLVVAAYSFFKKRK